MDPEDDVFIDAEILHRTSMGVKIRLEGPSPGDPDKEIWLPKHEIKISRKPGPVPEYSITMPRWLAQDRDICA